MHRTIFISNPTYLRSKDRQLKIVDPKTKIEKASIPIEDIGFLILDHPQITMSHYLVQELQNVKAAIVSCDYQHIPSSIQLPFAGHTEHTERLIQQAKMSEPLKKQLWKQTIEDKLANQALLLQKLGLEAQPIFDYASKVKSGDTTNREGIAAKYYWNQLFEDFVRDRFGNTPNHLLNFGYAILRSATARALCASGFHLALGIHHKNKYNATCLADDIMEPYRPFVDQLVLEYLEQNQNHDELDKTAKKHLLQLMQKDVFIDGKTKPLMIALTYTSASLYKCVVGEYKIIRYPIFNEL